ncbi:MAG: bifunctional (p)ppGpp synthetase/guanosine-3',5'-bis(diphosphate) 3'-pyrophosphohydrolase [Firmicutes bacterium]|nr:bifunctional (p)ppGpp synthetase/guanosine-3',5'-bis(diphosphate) 3'-pyrophosphohydrolase [Bacillota bacterium]
MEKTTEKAQSKPFISDSEKKESIIKTIEKKEKFKETVLESIKSGPQIHGKVTDKGLISVSEDSDESISEQVEELYKELVSEIEKYHPVKDYSMLEKAYNLAKQAHGEQKRKSGEPYIIHPLCVAKILAELELDMESIVAGLLHDVVEDTNYSLEELSNLFNPDVALLVDGVTKLEKIAYSSKEEIQAENYRKMFMSMAKDIRVILIKIADRLHNMRTLGFMTPEKQKEKAQETLDIYAPLADRLGISKIKTEMEDLCLRYLNPEAYYDLAEKIHRKQSEREKYVDGIVREIQQKCADADIKCTVYGRPKHFFSIYKKMKNKNKTLDQIFDLFAVRVLVDSVKDCYGVLGVVHEAYTPIPNRFKDYIATPKANMYQSLHNTLIGPDGMVFEIQIRTFEMHKTAEYGVAAHWKYKQGKVNGEEDSSEDVKLNWLRRILEWQRDMSDNKEFMETIKTDLDAFSDNVYCFSPSGDLISLVEGSTPVDFAYAIHSAVGNKMIGARVNNRIVTFDYNIKNGDRVEIITSQNSRGPSRDWLKFVKTSQARSKINQWYKKINKEENIQRGKELIEKEALKKGLPLTEIQSPGLIDVALERYSFKDWDSLCAAVGHGGLKEGQIINKLNEVYLERLKREKTNEQLLKEQEEAIKAQVEAGQTREAVRKKTKSGVYIEGVGDAQVRFSKCCAPVPGDEIVGFITRGRGVSIHRTDCVNIINLSEDERARLLEARWDQAGKEEGTSMGEYVADIRIFATDREGLLTMDVLKIMMDEGISVLNVNGRKTKSQKAIVDISIKIRSRNQLDFISSKIMKVPGVEKTERVTT